MITVFGINFSVHPFFIWSKIKFLTMKPPEYNRIRLPIHSFSFPKVGGQGYQFFFSGSHIENCCYEKGIKLSKKAHDKLETMIERVAGIEKWAVDIPYY